jgi:hypothetical protein
MEQLQWRLRSLTAYFKGASAISLGEDKLLCIDIDIAIDIDEGE